MRQSVPINNDAAELVCKQRDNCVLRHRNSDCKKSTLKALIVLITALLHITASVHVLVYVLSSSVLQAPKRYNYSTSFLFEFPAGLFSARNQCLPVCLWNFLRKSFKWCCKNCDCFSKWEQSSVVSRNLQHGGLGSSCPSAPAVPYLLVALPCQHLHGNEVGKKGHEYWAVWMQGIRKDCPLQHWIRKSEMGDVVLLLPAAVLTGVLISSFTWEIAE